MSKAQRKTKRRERVQTGPVLSLSVADYYRQMLTGVITPSPAPTFGDYLRVASQEDNT